MVDKIIASNLRDLINQMNELGLNQDSVLEGGPIKEGNQWILIYFK